MKTHYDVLKVDKNCTAEEIKNSFIKLSKMYHPDINKTSDAHKKFVEVNEAYSVLGKPCSRRTYDEKISSPFQQSQTSYNSYTKSNSYSYENSENFKTYTWGKQSTKTHEEFYRFRKTSALICCLIFLIGNGIHLLSAWRYSNNRYIVSQEISKDLDVVKDRNRIYDSIKLGLNIPLYNPFLKPEKKK